MKHPHVMIAALALTVSAFGQTPAPSTAAPAQPAKPAPVQVPSVPLSDSAKAKIAAMTPIFDGKTLNGWTQMPPWPLNIDISDLKDPTTFASKVLAGSDKMTALIAAGMDDAQKNALRDITANAKAGTSAITKAINALITGPSLYPQVTAAGAKLRPATEQLNAEHPTGIALARLNRMLLEDALPEDLPAAPSDAWVVKDGAMVSTGAGRGTIYTEKDYAHYRLVFLVRHAGAKPGKDHQPCVLIFCERPAAGERGRDALGGIQFQVPNGGHWDYRPGFNKGGDGFTNPVKTGYDNHEWRQVEILVDASKGEGRMAVAPSPGLRGIENLVYKMPEAGRAGPIAWQMHNAGIFDEFKDVRIELDPKDDRLITVE